MLSLLMALALTLPSLPLAPRSGERVAEGRVRGDADRPSSALRAPSPRTRGEGQRDALCQDLCAPDAYRHYRRLLAAAKWGLDGQERAAFLVSTPEGRLEAVDFTSGGAYRASNTGRIPRRAVAVIHTHPLRAHEPSDHDRAEARRIGLPVVVITPHAITVAYPDGTTASISPRRVE
jgi:proteasome lid subunit RPN8/RPN11